MKEETVIALLKLPRQIFISSILKSMKYGEFLIIAVSLTVVPKSTEYITLYIINGPILIFLVGEGF